ncbi:FYN-binding protein 1 [Maylandia zebra]|uniref:SH3 domain-containing protein n=1 Tax=Astatotilapia calliptera TaxID=8154 RepID=A0A3P8R1R4_ASTCA|nr:FYN-binding protein 1-like [Astatotilapia calliptera]
MGDSVDVKALRAKFNSKSSTSDTSSRDSGSPKSPRPGFGRAILPVAESELTQRLSPTIPPHLAGPGPVRLPRIEPMAASIPPRPGSFPRPPAYAGLRTPIQPTDATKVKQTGEMLQNMMLRHQKSPVPPVPQVPQVPQVPRLGAGSSAPVPPPTSTPLPLRQQPRQRSAGEVTPLRRPLPPEGPMPVKPKRPPTVNLEPFRRNRRGLPPALPAPRTSDGSGSRRMSLPVAPPAVVSPPKPPQRSDKPNRLQRQIASADLDEDEQDPYDDIDIDKNENCSEHSSQCVDGDDDDEVYEMIDEEQEKATMKEVKKKQEKDMKEIQKKMSELKKKFQLQGEIEVIHTAKVRYDWNGEGKLDLSVHQGDSVEILRVTGNPGGRWLARTMNGNYGYINNSCVDIDYEAVKIKHGYKKSNSQALPPPPPDPPQIFNMDSDNRDSLIQDEDDYDDVQPLPEDFPPPPPEISIDPKVEKDLKKKFKYDGPLRVLHTMLVDPNSIIKKPGAKDLPVTQGEIVDVIQLTNSKKALCRNRFGKYGYVSRSLLLPMEQDIYDDVDYADDVYDNDSL